jgi:hypothetical protein
MEDFQNNKDVSIQNLGNKLQRRLGKNNFEFTDFSDADLFAIDIKRGNKLIHISTWDYRNNNPQDMRYYSEFEFLEEDRIETQIPYKILKGVNSEELLNEIKLFFES